jgi:serine/threonine-protein kinase
VLGTAEFMAPEQADGRPVDPRSDLYSLGGVLYVLLARRPLYAARSFIEMLEKQRSEKPAPLHQMASDVPVELEQIIHRLLEKEPERRFATAMVLQRRLEAMLELLSMPPEVPSPADSPASGAATDLGAPVNPLGATVAATQPPERLPVTPVVPSGSAPLPSDPTPSAATPPADAPASPPRSSGRFVPVRPGELDQRPQERPAAPWISPQTWALVAGLLAVGLAAWYMLQPPSADALYERIQRRIEDDSTESLLQADEDIRHFIDHFSDDPRIAVMAEMTERIEVARQEKRLELQAKGVYVQPSPSPVEQCYIDAVNTARIDPGAAMAKYRAIIQLFEPSGEIPARNRRCVEIARRRLQELAQQDEAQSKEHLAELARQIERADELSKTDPQRAGAVYQAAIVLYQGKPWADPWIARARAAAEECRKRADKRESPLEPSGPKR